MIKHPARWAITEVTGGTYFADEPSAEVPAGTYLRGFDGNNEPQVEILLDVKFAMDGEGNAQQPEILTEMVRRLNSEAPDGR
jgi:hypothetical protein